MSHLVFIREADDSGALEVLLQVRGLVSEPHTLGFPGGALEPWERMVSGSQSLPSKDKWAARFLAALREGDEECGSSLVGIASMVSPVASQLAGYRGKKAFRLPASLVSLSKPAPGFSLRGSFFFLHRLGASESASWSPRAQSRYRREVDERYGTHGYIWLNLSKVESSALRGTPVLGLHMASWIRNFLVEQQRRDGGWIRKHAMLPASRLLQQVVPAAAPTPERAFASSRGSATGSKSSAGPAEQKDTEYGFGSTLACSCAEFLRKECRLTEQEVNLFVSQGFDLRTLVEADAADVREICSVVLGKNSLGAQQRVVNAIRRVQAGADTTACPPNPALKQGSHATRASFFDTEGPEDIDEALGCDSDLDESDIERCKRDLEKLTNQLGSDETYPLSLRLEAVNVQAGDVAAQVNMLRRGTTALNPAAGTWVPSPKPAHSGSHEMRPRLKHAVLELLGIDAENASDLSWIAEQALGELAPGWEVYCDERTGQTYYHNAKLGQTSWELPVDRNKYAQMIEAERARKRVPNGGLQNGWTQHTDKRTGRAYYHHAESGKTSWALPSPVSPPPPPTRGDTNPGPATRLKSGVKYSCRIGDVVVSVVQGDIASADTDVIVNAANGYLSHGAGVARAISVAAGERLGIESKAWVTKYGTVPDGKVAVTTGGNLSARLVVHAVGPQCMRRGYPSPSETQTLSSCVTEALKISLRYHAKSIAIPPISSGIFGYPKLEAACVIMDACVAFVKTQRKPKLSSIQLIAIDTPSVSAFIKAAARVVNGVERCDGDVGGGERGSTSANKSSLHTGATKRSPVPKKPQLAKPTQSPIKPILALINGTRSRANKDIARLTQAIKKLEHSAPRPPSKPRPLPDEGVADFTLVNHGSPDHQRAVQMTGGSSFARIKRVNQGVSGRGAVCTAGKIGKIAMVQDYELVKGGYLSKPGAGQEHIVFHGTPNTVWALGICRDGPDWKRIGTTTGSVYGRGFYTAAGFDTPQNYAGANGTVIAFKLAPGLSRDHGNKNDTLNTIAPNDIVQPSSNDYRVVFRSEQLCPELLIEYGPDPGGCELKKTTAELKLEGAWASFDSKHAAHTLKMDSERRSLISASYLAQAMDRYEAQADTAGPHQHDVLNRILRRVEREVKQFEQGLPVYSMKSQLSQSSNIDSQGNTIIGALHVSDALVITAETGAGKSTLVPIFVAEYLEDLLQHRKAGQGGEDGTWVAVLVPRRAIATGLARYVGPTLWDGKVGGGVGWAVRGNTCIDLHNSQIIFMTYGLFKITTMEDPDLKAFGAVVLDEVHERGIECDEVLPLVRDASIRRRRGGTLPPLKVVVMSATVDPMPFQRFFSNCCLHDNVISDSAESACPHVAVAGRSFPVDVVWPPCWPSDPNTTRATPLHEVGDAVVEIFKLEADKLAKSSKNIPAWVLLVFLPWVGAVQRAVSHFDPSLLSSNAREVEVFALHASLSSKERDAAIGFAASSANHGKAAIIFATNIAEAGVTIQGVRAVVDTGTISSPVYRYEDRIHDIATEFISKERAKQRAGRAGRTAAGTCYRLYTKAEFESQFPENTVPQLLEANLERHLIYITAMGGNPRELGYLTKPSDEAIDAGMQCLRDLHFIEAFPSTAATAAGKLASTLALDVRMVRCVLAATTPELRCADEMLKIAALLSTSNDGLKLKIPDKFVISTGDHESMLAMFESWRQSTVPGQTSAGSWFKANAISRSTEKALRDAWKLLGKLRLCFHKADVTLPSRPSSDPRRSECIRKALCCGLFDNTAIANSPVVSMKTCKHWSRGRCKYGSSCTNGHHGPEFTLALRFRTTAMTEVRLNSNGVLSGDKARSLLIAERNSFDSVVFQQLSRIRRSDGSSIVIMSGVSRIDPQWPKNMNVGWAKRIDFDGLQEAMARVSQEVPVPIGCAIASFSASIDSLQRQFPFATVGQPRRSGSSRDGTPTKSVLVSAPAGSIDAVVAGVSEALAAVSPAKSIFPTPADGRPLPKSVLAAFDPVRAKRGILQSLRVLWPSIDGKHVVVRIVQSGRIEIAVHRGVLLPQALAHLHTILSQYCGWNDSAGSGNEGDNGSAFETSALRDAGFRARLKHLVGDSVPITPQSSEGETLLALATFVTHHTPYFVYGGFVRDYMIRGDWHPSMDLDVGISLSKGQSMDDAETAITRFASSWQLSVQTASNSHSRVRKLLVTRTEGVGIKVDVELVDVDYWSHKAGKQVDFDVNNLLLVRNPPGYDYKYAGQGGSLDSIVANALTKRLFVLKEPTAHGMDIRIAKMQKRGWRIATAAS